MVDEEVRQTIADEEHLKVLSICYYVSAGMIALMSLFGLLYVVIGAFALAAGNSGRIYANSNEPSPEFMGALFIGIGIGMFGLGILGAILKVVAGNRIRRKRSRILCMVIAAIGCLEFPYGTLLGVFTFIVLGRNSVRLLFEAVPKQDSLP